MCVIIGRVWGEDRRDRVFDLAGVGPERWVGGRNDLNLESTLS